MLEAWGDLDAGSLPADRFALWRSTLTPAGAVHEVLTGYPLAPPEMG